MNRRRALGALAGLAVLPLLAASSCQPAPAEEAEDCDLDDLAEGDEDCYGKKSKKKPKRKSAPKKP